MKSMSLLILTLLAMVSGSIACNGVCSCDNTGAIMDCSNRGLTEPPSGLYRRVTRLDLTGNQISVVDKNSFSAFPSVSSLSLKENQLTEVYLEGLAFMSQLIELRLEDNRIQRIIPAPASRFGSLYHVFLNNNSLASLDPDTFLNAPKLQLLFLNYNPIVVPRGQAIVNNPSMEYLHMQYGSSLDLGPESFAGLPLLREVVVFSAGITSIQGAFVNNTRLSNIVLYYNLITEVTEGSFYSGNIIGGLKLSYNPLERLDVAALENALAPGASLAIEDTPLACSCNYESLYWWAQANGIDLTATCGGANKCSFSQNVDV